MGAPARIAPPRETPSFIEAAQDAGGHDHSAGLQRARRVLAPVGFRAVEREREGLAARPRREADDPRREDDGVRRCSLDATEERSSSSLGGRARSARGGRSRRLDRGRCVERGRSEETVRDDKPKSTSLPPPPSSAMSAGTALRDGLGAERRSSVRAFICFDTRAGLFDSSDSAAARLARPRSRICAVSSALRTLLTRSRSRLLAICSVVCSGLGIAISG